MKDSAFRLFIDVHSCGMLQFSQTAQGKWYRELKGLCLQPKTHYEGLCIRCLPFVQYCDFFHCWFSRESNRYWKYVHVSAGSFSKWKVVKILIRPDAIGTIGALFLR